MPRAQIILAMRLSLLLVVLFTVGAGVLLTEPFAKVVASASGSIFAGILVSLILKQVSETEPTLWAQVNRNAAEAQRMLNEARVLRWWNYGAQQNYTISTSTQDFSEILKHPMIALLLLTITAILWMSPAFNYSASLSEAPSPFLVKALGTHALAILLMGGAVMGIGLRFQKKRHNEP